MTMNLGELIARLEAADPQQVVQHGFRNPHSYRGDYMDLAFEPATDVAVADMLADARSALGATYEGWKGGDFTMGEHSWCWLSQEGDASGETISALLLDFMLAPAVAPVVPPTADRAVLRDRIRRAICEAEGFMWDSDMLEPDEYGDVADAVLAVLPEPADRAAVLREAADAVFALDYDVMVGEEGDENLGSMREAWDLGTIHAEKLLRRLAAEAQRELCGECGHPHAVHREGDDPVSPGQCADCPDDDAWHNYETAAQAPTTTKPETQACDGCGHPEHPAHNCPDTLYGVRCACDEPIAAGVGQDGAQPS